MKTNRRVFIIGLDGATWKILNPLIEEGTLPHLKSLIERGIQSNLISIIPPVTAPAWVSFQTGVNPGKHGIYEFDNYIPGTYRTKLVNSQLIPLKTIWQIAGEQGKKIITVNVPITYPPYPVNGCMVTGMLTPNTKSVFTYPEKLSQEILTKVPGYRILTTQNVFNLKGLKTFLDELIKTETKRTQVMKHLLQDHPWDLAMIHYQSTDVLQHAVYGYLDPQSHNYDKNKYALIKRFYHLIDKNIGELLKIVPESALKIVMSDHGFTSVNKLVHLNVFLTQNSWLKSHQQGLTRRLLGSTLVTLSELDRFNINRFILGRKRNRIRKSLSVGFFVDWKHTQAFMINGWVYGNIYLNLRDREKEGIVSRQRYDSLSEEIIQALYKLEDADNGKIIRQVYRKKDIYHGPYLKNAPDLIVRPNTGYEFSPILFRKGKLLRAVKPRRAHLGSHDLEGILVIQGDIINTEASTTLKDSPPHIVDLFPTILFALGLKIPDYVDGKILELAFTPEYVKVNPPAFKSTPKKGITENHPAYTEQDQEQIKKRLKHLGYL